MNYYCTKCGTVGRPRRITRGYFRIEVMRWFLFLIPGLIYSLWRLASRYDGCPACGEPKMIPVNSPIARAAVVGTGTTRPRGPIEHSWSYRLGRRLGELVRRG